MASRRHPILVLLLFVVVLIADGCGSGGGVGGDGGGGGQISNCSLTAFTPNYADQLDHLLNWPSFPVSVFFVQDANWSAHRQALAVAGFNQWVTATGDVLSYTVVSSQSSADITVRFDPTTANGETAVQFTGLTLASADMKIGIQNQADTDLQCVAAHEFGHALGIDGHSPNPADLMYPIHYAGTSCDITSRDLNTMKTGYCHLFGRASERCVPVPTGPRETKTIQQDSGE